MSGSSCIANSRPTMVPSVYTSETLHEPRSGDSSDSWGPELALGIREKYETPSQISDEETWLTPPEMLSKFRRGSPPVRSASMSVLNESAFHSTPTRNTRENQAGGDAPIRNRTMDRDELARAFGAVSPVQPAKENGENASSQPDGSSVPAANRTFEKEKNIPVLPVVKNGAPERMKVLPKKNIGPPVTKSKLMPPTKVAAPSSQTRDTQSSPLNRTSSLGNLANGFALAPTGLQRPRAIVPVVSSVTGNAGIIRPKMPLPSRLPAPSRIPAPSGMTSRIPRPPPRK